MMVTIRCLAYNQERYIRECLDGFVMQQTSFCFEAIVHDDASTDGTADIIREYESKYPDIIIPIYEQENQYSKQNGSLRRIMDEHTHGKYIALCEGDDYWIDPLKLQKQFDYMESHPEYSLCFHAHKNLEPTGEMSIQRPRVIKDTYFPGDAILGGGSFMATNSMFYRREFLLREKIPEFWNNCPVGDAPSMLFLSSKGLIGYIDEVMSIYRRQAIGSWSTRNIKLMNRYRHYCAILEMYDGFDKYTNGKYHYYIKKKKSFNRRRFLKNCAKTIVKRTISFIIKNKKGC